MQQQQQQQNRTERARTYMHTSLKSLAVAATRKQTAAAAVVDEQALSWCRR